MDNYPITITKNKAVHHFEIGEYLNHDEERCKYRVYENRKYVASFTPDAQNFLHICQNPGELEEGLLYELADQIEAQIPHAESRHFNDNNKEDEL